MISVNISTTYAQFIQQGFPPELAMIMAVSLSMEEAKTQHAETFVTKSDLDAFRREIYLGFWKRVSVAALALLAGVTALLSNLQTIAEFFNP